jgi:hypothetical protein
MRASKLGSVVAFIVSGVIILTAVWLFFHRQTVLDWVAVQSFTPSSEVEAINKRVAFTDAGKFTFYATKPEVESEETFNKECPRQEAGSPILGCYTTDDRIYIYNLTNEQLDGMEEVTAAHEMLHAVWFRTSKEDQEKLKVQLTEAFDSLSDTELKSRMEYYERTEPGEFANELHSILGTEVASLGEPLESYYEKFFSREKVLSLYGQYHSVYATLNNRADALYREMETLSASIESRSATYDANATQLSADINSFNTQANSGSFTSQSQFNSERASLVRRTNQLEAERNAINNDIIAYNAYYAEYQDISNQIEVLNDSVDSFKQIDEAPSV